MSAFNDVPLPQMSDLSDRPRERPRWTMREAAQATGASLSTIRRKTEAGAFPNAEKDARGTWRIPVTDLLAAGYSLAQMGTPAPPMSAPTELPQTAPVSADERARIAQLERELAETRAQRDIAEARRIAAEQVTAEAQHGRQLAERAMLMLEAANPRTATPQAVEQPPATPDPQPEATSIEPHRRRWPWRR